MTLNGLSARAFCNRKKYGPVRKGLVVHLNIGDLPLVEGQKRNHRLMSKNIKLTIKRQSNNTSCFSITLLKLCSPYFLFIFELTFLSIYP
jgi:hypothetical protein